MQRSVMKGGKLMQGELGQTKKIKKYNKNKKKAVEHTLLCGPLGRFKPVMVTLTYRVDEDWAENDIKQAMKRCKDWLRYRGIRARYIWVAELTQAGKLHYHALVFVPYGVQLPKFDEIGWWTKGSSNAEWCRSPLAYLAKYSSKGAEGRGRFPKGARIHATAGLDAESRNQRTYFMMPAWVREQFSAADKPRRAPGGGILCRATGLWVDSPYEVVHAERGRVCIAPKSLASWF